LQQQLQALPYGEEIMTKIRDVYSHITGKIITHLEAGHSVALATQKSRMRSEIDRSRTVSGRLLMRASRASHPN